LICWQKERKYPRATFPRKPKIEGLSSACGCQVQENTGHKFIQEKGASTNLSHIFYD